MDIFTAASYIVNRYQREFGERIEEMKLHKLLYFAQRECIVRNNEPMFEERFEGWRLGPVAPMLRPHYANNTFYKDISDDDVAEYQSVMDYVFKEYAPRNHWSLSRLSQGESCWLASRNGIPRHESSNRIIHTEDIFIDAARIRERRIMLEQMGLLEKS